MLTCTQGCVSFGYGDYLPIQLSAQIGSLSIPLHGQREIDYLREDKREVMSETNTTDKVILPGDLAYGNISGPHDCAVLARASKEQCEARIAEIENGDVTHSDKSEVNEQ